MPRVIGDSPIGDSSRDAPPDERTLRAALDLHVLQSMRPLMGGLAIFYVFLAVSHTLVLPPAIAPRMTALALGTALALLGARYALQRRPVDPRWAHAIAAVVYGLALFNSLLHLYLLPEPHQSTNIALVMIGAGCFCLSRRWLVVMLGAALGGWSLVVGSAGGLHASPNWLHFGFTLLASTLLAWLIYTTRRRALERIEHLRYREIQQKQELERALDAARGREAALQEAQEGMRTRDHFLTVAAHELRTPVTALFGYTQLLTASETQSAPMAERDTKAIQVIAEQAERLAKLIDLLLDLSRIDSGHFAIELRLVDLRVVVTRVIEQARLTTTQHALELECHGDPLTVQGDEQRLEQMLQNLLQNAIKYSPAGGTIVVRLERRAEEILLSVRDQGIGIPEEEHQSLFQRFFRASNAASQQASGFGIGLFVVNEIVARHGGSIDVSSEQGKGSTFTVHLPLSP